MFRNAHFDRLRQTFADQFTSDEHGLIYRKYQKGVPIRVSEAERDSFVATFNKRIRYATWSIFPATVGLILLLAWLIPDADSAVDQLAVWVGIAVILAPFLTMFYWAWNAPSRQLERRTPAGAALTKKEARELAFSKITYGQLALVPLGALALIWKISTRTDVFHGPGVFWLVAGAALILMAGVQAFRKWLISQQ